MDYREENFETNNQAITTANREVTSTGEGQLTVDVFQTENEIVVKSTIAGVGINDLDISLTNDMVIIRGARHSEDRIKNEDYYHRELHWGAFSRSIILPEDVDVNGAKAALKNGILTIRLPKLSKSRNKKVRIST